MGLTVELVAFALGVDHRLITAAYPGRDTQAPHECANHHDLEHGHRDAGLGVDWGTPVSGEIRGYPDRLRVEGAKLWRP